MPVLPILLSRLRSANLSKWLEAGDHPMGSPVDLLQWGFGVVSTPSQPGARFVFDPRKGWTRQVLLCAYVRLSSSGGN